MSTAHAGSGARTRKRTPPSRAQSAVVLGYRLAQGLALAAGAVLIALVVFICANIAIRQIWRPIPGVYELIELVLPAISLGVMPWCHAAQGHIRLALAWGTKVQQQRLTHAAHILMVLVFALLTWRMSVGMIDKFYNFQVTSLLQLPLWWRYAGACTVAVLTTVSLALMTGGSLWGGQLPQAQANSVNENTA